MADLSHVIDPDSLDRWRTDLQTPSQLPDAEWVLRLLMRPQGHSGSGYWRVDCWPDRLEIHMCESAADKWRALQMTYSDAGLDIQQALG